MSYSWNKIWEATKMVMMLCILGFQGFWFWGEVIQPREALKALEIPLKTAVQECSQERDYQSRIRPMMGELHARTSDYLKQTFVISNEACKREDTISLQLLSSNVSPAKVALIKKTSM